MLMMCLIRLMTLKLEIHFHLDEKYIQYLIQLMLHLYLYQIAFYKIHLHQ